MTTPAQSSTPQASTPQNNASTLFSWQLPQQMRAYYRLFKQVVGLFDSIPLEVVRDPKNELLVNTFHEIKSTLNDKFGASDSKAHVALITAEMYRLEVILVRLLLIEDLIFRLEGYRQEYANLVGEQTYLAYLNSIGYRQSLEASAGKIGNDEFIRADAIYLISQIQSYQMLREGGEGARTYLLSRLWRYTALIIVALCAPIVIFFADILYFRSHGTFLPRDSAQPVSTRTERGASLSFANFFQPAPSNSTPAAETSPTPDAAAEETQTPDASPEEDVAQESEIPSYFSGPPGESPFSVIVAAFTTLSFACIAGALGAFVSAASRIQRLGINHELMRNSLGLDSSAAQLKWTPVVGVIFAFVLSLVFGGGFVQGNLFPVPAGVKSWLTILYLHDELAKLLVWCFIAGFSERFVPDLLDRLLLHSKENVQTDKSPQPAVVVTEPSGTGGKMTGQKSGVDAKELKDS